MESESLRKFYESVLLARLRSLQVSSETNLLPPCSPWFLWQHVHFPRNRALRLAIVVEASELLVAKSPCHRDSPYSSTGALLLVVVAIALVPRPQRASAKLTQHRSEGVCIAESQAGRSASSGGQKLRRTSKPARKVLAVKSYLASDASTMTKFV